MLFIQQIFVKQLLCARHCEQNEQNPCPHEVHRIMGMDRKRNKINRQEYVEYFIVLNPKYIYI